MAQDLVASVLSPTSEAKKMSLASSRDRVLAAALEVELHITPTNIKPGHPLAFGTRGETLFFSPPGYPSDTPANALVYPLPTIRKTKSLRDCRPATITALTGKPLQAQKAGAISSELTCNKK